MVVPHAKVFMITLNTTQRIPLTIGKDGAIRVNGTRLLVEMIVTAYKRGECPEKIFEAFPSSEYTVADIYSIISYYLTHQNKIDAYIEKRADAAGKLRKQIESVPEYEEKREKLKRNMLSKK